MEFFFYNAPHSFLLNPEAYGLWHNLSHTNGGRWDQQGKICLSCRKSDGETMRHMSLFLGGTVKLDQLQSRTNNLTEQVPG